MGIPDLPVFEEFLAACRVLTERPASGVGVLLHETATSVHGAGSSLWLEYPRSTLQPESMLRRLAEELAAAGMPSTPSVARAVLGLIVATKGAEGHVQHANRALGTLRRGDFLFNFISPGPPAAADVRADYGLVAVETFDPRKLEYWAGRGGARWPTRPGDLRGRIAFVGQVRSATLLDTDALPGAERLGRQGAAAASAIVDAYYQAAADALLDEVSAATAERLSLVEAAGIFGFDFSSVAEWSIGMHLFTWPSSGRQRAGCWALYREPTLLLNTPPAAIWREATGWLIEEFGLDSLGGDRPIEVLAQTFARLMQDARNHLSHGRMRESFLYFVIALDHLLGEDGNNTATVGDRTGVVTHRTRSKAFADEARSVRQVYEARSRLVHSGAPITREQLREAEAIAQAALWAVTRVVADRKIGTREEWTKRIDSLVHLFRGDPSVVTSERLSEVGGAVSFAAAPPPVLRDRTAAAGEE